MFTAAKTASNRILVVRLGAMGDIIHTLPAVASLKHSHPGYALTWIVEPRWAELLSGNPFVDQIAFLRRGSMAGLMESWRELRQCRFEFAVDFQGLIKSALVATAARADRIFGFDQHQIRERAAALFYSNRAVSHADHVVDRNLELAAAAGATTAIRTFPLPQGTPEGDLPEGAFVLASPLAGWRSKQWPMEHYRALASRLAREFRIPLVLNGPPGADLPAADGIVHHFSSLAGLIHASRRASAVIGVDSGPMHLAAALSRPGVAIFGPTDPVRNGPYGGSFRVLRSATAETTYQRGNAIDKSMHQITPDQVFEALRAFLGGCSQTAGCPAR
jgi:heptosyltransferase-1